MAFILGDSLDYLASADLTAAGWLVDESPTITVSGRNGTSALRLGTSPATSATRPLGSSYATLIVGAAHYFASGISTSNNFVQFIDSGGVVHVYFRINAGGFLVVYRGDGTILQTTTWAPLVNTWYYIETKFTIADGVAGHWEVRVNGVTVAQDVGGGDTRNGGVASVDRVKFQVMGGGTQHYVDDFYVCDTSGATCNDFLGDIRGISQFANADGASVSWTPSAGARFNCVNKATPTADATYISELTPGDISSFTFPALGVTGSVKAVVTQIYARKDDAGSRSIREYCLSAATAATGVTVSLSDSNMYIPQVVREVDPATAAAWLVAAVNAAAAGVELVS